MRPLDPIELSLLCWLHNNLCQIHRAQNMSSGQLLLIYRCSGPLPLSTGTSEISMQYVTLSCLNAWTIKAYIRISGFTLDLCSEYRHIFYVWIPFIYIYTHIDRYRWHIYGYAYICVNVCMHIYECQADIFLSWHPLKWRKGQ